MRCCKTAGKKTELLSLFCLLCFNKVMDMCWLDDQFLVSGSKDAKMALWRINEDVTDTLDGHGELACPTYARVSALAVKECRAAQKIRSLCFNRDYKEIAVISLNGYIHIFNAETFSQKLSRKLPNCQDNVCIASQPQGLYAVGCRSYTLLLDPRTLQVSITSHTCAEAPIACVLINLMLIIYAYCYPYS